jgi:hypothetical protein
VDPRRPAGPGRDGTRAGVIAPGTATSRSHSRGLVTPRGRPAASRVLAPSPVGGVGDSSRGTGPPTIRHSPAALTGYVQMLRGPPHALATRRQIQRRRLTDGPALRRWVRALSPSPRAPPPLRWGPCADAPPASRPHARGGTALDRAALMRRPFAIDVLACLRCGRRLPAISQQYALALACLVRVLVAPRVRPSYTTGFR